MTCISIIFSSKNLNYLVLFSVLFVSCDIYHTCKLSFMLNLFFNSWRFFICLTYITRMRSPLVVVLVSSFILHSCKLSLMLDPFLSIGDPLSVRSMQLK